MKTNIIEFSLILILALLLGKGLLFSVIIGLALFVIKRVYNRLTGLPYFTDPSKSLRNGVFAGLVALILNFIF